MANTTTNILHAMRANTSTVIGSPNKKEKEKKITKDV